MLVEYYLVPTVGRFGVVVEITEKKGYGTRNKLYNFSLLVGLSDCVSFSNCHEAS